MKKLVRIIIGLLLWLWQLPQNIVGLGFLLFLREKTLLTKMNNVRIYISPFMRGGISLGNYIFLSNRYNSDKQTINHEYGHCKQSRILGWLYLIVIGLPSVVHAGACKRDNYYHFYTEKWADKLMKIKR